jgi:hypothetical protein
LAAVPSIAIRGRTVTLTGKGFSAGATVGINVCSVKAFAIIAQSGQINVAFKVPDSTPLGPCKITARGLGANKQTLTLTTTVTVKSATETILKLSRTKVAFGNEQVEQMSVTVSPEFAAPAVTGKVTIHFGKANLCSRLLKNGKASCTLNPKELGTGTYHLVASYDGNLKFTGSFAKEVLTIVK